MTRALVVGAGSIGSRHALVLGDLGHDVALVTSRTDVGGRTFPDVASAIDTFDPEYVVVATETARHSDAVGALAAAGYTRRLLVEKPLAVSASELDPFDAVGVAFNLRFHPVLARIAEVTASTTVYTAEAYVGQHLATWRPGRDVRATYSASKARGGGALRDLSHELDYLAWLLGGCEGLFALGGRVGDVTDDADDAWGILARYRRSPIVTLQLNYLDTHTRRRIVLNTSEGTIEGDLVAGTVRRDGEPEAFDTGRHVTYTAMHVAMLAGGVGVATVSEAETTDDLVLAIEKSAATGEWVGL